MLRKITVQEFFLRSSGISSDILRPSNHAFPLYLSLKYASSMDMFRVFPNLLGRVKR